MIALLVPYVGRKICLYNPSPVYLAGFAAALEVAALAAAPGAVLDAAPAAGLGLAAAAAVGFGAAAVLDAPAAEGVGLDAVRVGAAPTWGGNQLIKMMFQKHFCRLIETLT